ncbi:uncharacterized protein LOC131937681 [Physella acuta]|uniref:uncharacterized protein LOC131937681 n=1 Tax=Physella acuta TaxID=109671 RepID=UPI0027DCD8EB|nr:uncharacterized protein LOC131937681 [Physella acuta]
MFQDTYSGLINPDVLNIFLAISLVLESLLSIVGVAGNIISIVVFSQQGYRETTNISLTALALSDIGAILTLQTYSIMSNPFMLNADVNFDPVDFTLNYIGWIKSPNTNTTFLGIIFRQNRDAIFAISYFITDLAVPYFTFAIIIVCTSFTVTSLITSSSWRKSLAGAASDVKSRRYRKERKLIPMLSVISVVFIVCQIPQSVLLTVTTVIRKLTIRGKYFDISSCCYIVIVFMENINSAVNPLVYYKMSKKYRDTCRKLFRKYLFH